MSSRLSSLLVQDGLVSAKRVADAFQRQVIYGGTLDSNLLELKAVDEDDLISYLGRADGMPTQPTGIAGAGLPLAEVLEVFTKELAERFRAVPTKLLPGGVLQVLVPDGVEITELDELALRVEQRIEPWITLEFRFVEAMDKVYGTGTPSRYARLLARSVAAHQGRDWPPARPIQPLPRFGSLAHLRLVPEPPPPPVVVVPPTVDEPTALMVAPIALGENTATLQIAAALAESATPAALAAVPGNTAEQSTTSLRIPATELAAAPAATTNAESTGGLAIPIIPVFEPGRSTATMEIPSLATASEPAIPVPATVSIVAPLAAAIAPLATAAEPTVDMAIPAAATTPTPVAAAPEPTATAAVPTETPAHVAESRAAVPPSARAAPAAADRRAPSSGVPELLPTQLIDPNSIRSGPTQLDIPVSAVSQPDSAAALPLDDLSVADWMSAADWLSVANKVDPVVSAKSPAPTQRVSEDERAAAIAAAEPTTANMKVPVEPTAAERTAVSMPVPVEPAAERTAVSMPVPVEPTAVALPIPAEPAAAERAAVSMPIPAEVPVEKSTQLAVPAAARPVVETKPAPAATPAKQAAPPLAETGGRKKGKKGKDAKAAKQAQTAAQTPTKPAAVPASHAKSAAPANQAKPGVPVSQAKPGTPAAPATPPSTTVIVATPPAAQAAASPTAAVVPTPAQPVAAQTVVATPAVPVQPAAADSQAKPAQVTSPVASEAKPGATSAAASGPVSAVKPSATSAATSGPVAAAKPSTTSAAASGPVPAIKPSTTSTPSSGPVTAAKPSAAASSGPVSAVKPSDAAAPGSGPAAKTSTPSGTFPVPGAKPSTAAVPGVAAKVGTPSGAFSVVKPADAAVGSGPTVKANTPSGVFPVPTAKTAEVAAKAGTPSGTFPVVKPADAAVGSGPTAKANTPSGVFPVPTAKPAEVAAKANTPSGVFPVVKPADAAKANTPSGVFPVVKPADAAKANTPSGVFPVVKPADATAKANPPSGVFPVVKPAEVAAKANTPSGVFPVVKPADVAAKANTPSGTFPVPGAKPGVATGAGAKANTPSGTFPAVKPAAATGAGAAAKANTSGTFPVVTPGAATAKPATPSVTTELAEPPVAPPRDPRSAEPAPKPQVAAARPTGQQPAIAATTKPERDSRIPDPVPEPVNSGRLGEIIVKEPSQPAPAPRSGESPVPRLGPPPRVATALDAGGSSELSLEAARELAGTVDDRDAIFEALCRGARSRCDFAAVFTLHGEVAFGRVALHGDWVDRTQLGRIAIPVDRNSPFRTVAKERTTFLGMLGHDATASDALRALGRSTPMAAAILPVLVRGRAVALLYIDDDGRELTSGVIDELKPLLADVGQAFGRIAQKGKAGGLGAESEAGVIGEQMPTTGTTAFRSASAKSPRAGTQLVTDSQSTPLPPNLPAAAASPVPELAAEQPTVPLRVAPPAKAADAAKSAGAAVPEHLHSQPTVPLAVANKIAASPAAPASGSAKSPVGKNDKRGGKPAEVSASPAIAARDTGNRPSLGDLIDRAGKLDETAIDQLLTGGAEAARALVAALPGPLRNRERQALGDPAGGPVYSRGPLLALALRMGHSIVEPLLARLADSATTTESRYYLMLCLAESPVPAAIGALAQGLYDNDDSVRFAAVTALRNFPPSGELTAVVSKLRDAVDGADVKRSRYAVEALGELRIVSAVPQLINLLDHEDPALVDALGRALQTITKQDFGRSRVRWTSWWRRRQDEPRLQWLLESLTHPSAMLRSAAQDELTSLSGDVVGYRFDQPRRDRELARKRWAQWWQRRGYPVL